MCSLCKVLSHLEHARIDSEQQRERQGAEEDNDQDKRLES